MQDCLGGNAKTLLFVTASTAPYNLEETLTSLTSVLPHLLSLSLSFSLSLSLSLSLSARRFIAPFDIPWLLHRNVIDQLAVVRFVDDANDDPCRPLFERSFNFPLPQLSETDPKKQKKQKNKEKKNKKKSYRLKPGAETLNVPHLLIRDSFFDYNN